MLHDWRDFQNTPAMDEESENSILINDYVTTLHKSGWRYTHIIPVPLSPERFKGNAASAMQKKRILGTTGRHVIIAEKNRVCNRNSKCITAFFVACVRVRERIPI